MNKFLLTLFSGIILLSNTASAAENEMQEPQKMPPECQAIFDYMYHGNMEIDTAIQENNANKVGELVIRDYNYVKEFLIKNPQCKTISNE